LSIRLVTTSIKETWPESGPVVFLGQWCWNLEDEKLWKHKDYSIAAYHWDDREKLAHDYCYLKNLHERLIIDLCGQLNKIHSVNYSPRYWQIIIGPWLGYFTQALFDRWSMLQSVLSYDEEFECHILDNEQFNFTANDMASFLDFTSSDDWNEFIYSQLIEYLPNKNFKIRIIPKLNKSRSHVENTKKNNIKKSFINIASKWNVLGASEDDYFFISTYLPKKLDIKLQIKLGQIPKFYFSPHVPKIKINKNLRLWNLNETSDGDQFELILRDLIPIHLPKLYLEGYKHTEKIASNLGWPIQPKVIFTSNAYLSQDIFKIWASKKIEEGCALVIGQHGGNFGMVPWAFHQEHQFEIADKFITWGWSDKKNKKIVPVGNFVNLNKKVGYDSRGGALMVATTVPKYSSHLLPMPLSSQWLKYIKFQHEFVSLLSNNIKNSMIVRLSSNDYGWQQENRWLSKFPDIKIDLGYKNIEKLIRKNRIYITTYNATTYLESLALNIPTLVFWDEKYWEVNDRANYFFQLLREQKVFHNNVVSAADHLNSIWSDIDSWWYSESVQSAREIFCNEYSNLDLECLDNIKAILNSQ
jgi:putative transferase (TIGR04331 family)